MNANVSFSSRYRLADNTQLGAGVYGMVVEAFDTMRQDTVAVKCSKVSTVSTALLKRAIREVKIMKMLRQHENILPLYDAYLRPSGQASCVDMFLVSQKMDTDLSFIIQSTQELSFEHLKFFGYQILRGLKYMHSANILHRDLKPQNVLVNSDCDLKICDFGLSRQDLEDSACMNCMTEYVQTRWYRAPEVLGGWGYGKPADIWSVGVILLELLLRRCPLKGRDTKDQLRLIVAVLGSPSEEELNIVQSAKARAYLRGLPPSEKRPLLEALSSVIEPAGPLTPQVPPPLGDTEALEILDLIGQMLQFDPAKRISAEAALAHPVFGALHVPDDEPSFNLAEDGEGHRRFEFESTGCRQTLEKELRTEITKIRTAQGIFDPYLLT